MQSGSTSINDSDLQPDQAGHGPRPPGAVHPSVVPGTEGGADYIHEPWMLGVGGQLPIVDVTASMQDAKDRIWEIRRSAGLIAMPMRFSASMALAKRG